MELALNPRSLGEQLSAIHQRIREEFPRIERLGVALYDSKTDVLKAFVHGSNGPNTLSRYEILLSETPSLLALAQSGEARVLADLSTLASSPADHAQRVLESGGRSSFTRPFFSGGRLAGFLFFNSSTPGYFAAPLVDRLSVFARLLSLMLLNGLEPVHLLRSAVHLAAELTRFRDAEMGMHLERVSHYARLIAGALPPSAGLDDEFIEYLDFFTPVHDIGKVAIPDHVLFKDGVLTPAEFEIVKTHVTSGAAVVEGLIRDLDLEGFAHVSMLRNIVRSHHEVLDGSGYPDGLRAGQIPMEARIVAVADVFDALTSDRPYKKTWSAEEALGYLVERKGTQFDAACVAAFESHTAEVTSIRQRFRDRATG